MKNEDQIINVTPHSITVVAPDGRLVASIPPSGQVWRLESCTVPDRTVRVNNVEIPITYTEYSDSLTVDDNERSWPPVVANCYYIVSQLIKNANPNRPDLLVPAEMQRDKDGKILGCLSLGV